MPKVTLSSSNAHTQRFDIQQQTHHVHMQPQKPTLFEKIWNILCCCCPPRSTATHAHREVPDPELEALYEAMNGWDYQQVHEVISKAALTTDKKTKILTCLDQMRTRHLFLDPAYLAKECELSSGLFKQIKSFASLATVINNNPSLRLPQTEVLDKSKLMWILDSQYVSTSKMILYDRSSTPQQQLDCILWGVFYNFEDEHKPDSISQLTQDGDLDEKEHKFTNPVPQTSLEILKEII